MIPEGKGVMVWIPRSDRVGTIDNFVQTVIDMKFSWVALKFQQGIFMSESDSRSEKDFEATKPDEIVKAFRDAGIAVHGWCGTVNYSTEWTRKELVVTHKVMDRFQPDSWILDIEQSWDRGGGAYFAKKYCSEFVRDYPNIPLALCSYRFPSAHPGTPWDTFMEFMSYNMPQVYWVDSHDAAFQVNKSFHELDKISQRVLGKSIPFVPVGAAYAYGKWKPTTDDMDDFVNELLRLKCPAWSWWLYELILKQPDWKQAITNHPMYPPDAPLPPTQSGYEDLPVLSMLDWADKLNRWAYQKGFKAGRPS